MKSAVYKLDNGRWAVISLQDPREPMMPELTDDDVFETLEDARAEHKRRYGPDA